MAWFVGQEVFDAVHCPDKAGKIIAVNVSGNYPIRVKFGEFIYDYTTKGRVLEYSIPTLKNYSYGVVFKEIETTKGKLQKEVENTHDDPCLIIVHPNFADKLISEFALVQSEAGYFYNGIKVFVSSVSLEPDEIIVI
jgi:hypothetical protein